MLFSKEGLFLDLEIYLFCFLPFPAYGEGSGNPLQYSCLENPVDGGPWWAAVHGVAESRTRLSDWATSLSCIGEGNGNPLQCSCLENPRDSGAWWVAICGVAQSQTRLKWLSSSSSVPTYVRWRVLLSSSLVTEILWLPERFLRCCLSSSAKTSLRFKKFPCLSCLSGYFA